MAMKIIGLIVLIAIAIFFTVSAIKITYEEEKNLCKISAFVWWICAAASFIHLVIY